VAEGSTSPTRARRPGRSAPIHERFHVLYRINERAYAQAALPADALPSAGIGLFHRVVTGPVGAELLCTGCADHPLRLQSRTRASPCVSAKTFAC